MMMVGWAELHFVVVTAVVVVIDFVVRMMGMITIGMGRG